MGRSDPYVLYVHPYNHVVDELVPMGAVALLNRVTAPKLGRYAYELSEADIEGAGCVALDLHWYFSIEAVNWIAADIKRVRPELPIILGGITASFYAEYLIEAFPIDFVIAGDAEFVFPRLVEALLAGERPPPLPNTWVKAGGAPSTRLVDADEYAENDYLSLDWFPTLQSHTYAMHAEYARTPFWGRMDRYHPYVPLNRGCRFPCEGCFGSYQREVFGPGQVDRGAHSLAHMLDAVEAHPHYEFVTLTGGTEDVQRFDAYRPAFSRKRALGAYVMHFCDLPSDETLHMLLDGFDRLCVDFTNPSDVPLPLRAKSIPIEQAERRIVEIARLLDGRDDCRMGISFMSTEPHPFKDRLLEADLKTVSLKENSEWALPRPNVMELPQADKPGLLHLRRAKRDGKRAQAEKFRQVSRGHAYYVVARALAPSLYPILDQSYLQWVDGTPRTAVEPADLELRDFQAWYVDTFRQWFVTTLTGVQVSVRWLRTTEPLAEPELRDASAADWLGPTSPSEVVPSFDGLRVRFQGDRPPGDQVALAVLPRLGWGEGRWLEPATLSGLLSWCLPAGDDDQSGDRSCLLDARLSQHRCSIRLARGPSTLCEREWTFEGLLPSTPLLPQQPVAAQATENGFGPTDLLREPFADTRLPRMAVSMFERALQRDAAGFQWELVEASERWVCHRFTAADAELHTFVMTPSTARHYCATRHFALVYQEARPGVAQTPAAQRLLQRLARLLRLLDSTMSSAPTYAG